MKQIFGIARKSTFAIIGGLLLGISWYIDKYKMSESDKSFQDQRTGLVDYGNLMNACQFTATNTSNLEERFSHDSSSVIKHKLCVAYGTEISAQYALYTQGQMNIGYVKVKDGQDSDYKWGAVVNKVVAKDSMDRLKSLLNGMKYVNQRNSVEERQEGQQRLLEMSNEKDKYENRRNILIIVGTIFTILNSLVLAYREDKRETISTSKKI